MNIEFIDFLRWVAWTTQLSGAWVWKSKKIKINEINSYKNTNNTRTLITITIMAVIKNG